MLTAFRFRKSAYNRSEPSFFGARTIGLAHSVVVGLMISSLSILSVSFVKSFLAVNPAWYGALCTGLISSVASSIMCFEFVIRLKLFKQYGPEFF